MTALINSSPVICSASHSCNTATVTWNKKLNLSVLSIDSLIQPDMTLKPFAWLPLAVTNVPALNRGVQTGRHFSDFYQTEFINAGYQDLWQQLVQRESLQIPLSTSSLLSPCLCLPPSLPLLPAFLSTLRPVIALPTVYLSLSLWIYRSVDVVLCILLDCFFAFWVFI